MSVVYAQYCIAQKLIELKTICHCRRKANFVIRLNSGGNAATQGEQVEICVNERFKLYAESISKITLIYSNLQLINLVTRDLLVVV